MKWLKTTLVYGSLFLFSFGGIMTIMADLFKSEETIVAASTIVIFITFIYFHDQEFNKER